MKNYIYILGIIISLFFYNQAYSQYEGGESSGFDYGNVGSSGDEEMLPVELNNFTVKAVNNSALLEWSTLSEYNNYKFVIQKSKDNENWMNIGQINGAGNSNSLLKYSFKDSEVYKSINYYRIKQIDFDGKFTYSKSKSLIIIDEEINVYPNPVKEKLYVNCKEIDINKIEVYNIVGKSITASLYIERVSDDCIEINSESIKSGIYFIKYKSTLVKFIVK